MKDMINKIILGDCLEIMKGIADKSIDMILCDLPYGTTACKWDTIIPFDKLWEQYNRVIKDNGAIVLTASQPFTTDVINSNRNMFRYEWIWEKALSGNPFLVKKQPLKVHENILVFYKKLPTYNPQFTIGIIRNKKISGSFIKNKQIDNINDKYYPRTVQYFANADRKNKIHETQKPIALMEYLIKTYTHENEIVLDNCIGSGTTAIAAIRTGRQFIGIEKDSEYHRLACERVEKEQQNLFKLG